MGRRTAYFCDGCGNEKQKKELKGFHITKTRPTYYIDNKRVDFCEPCRIIVEGVLPAKVTDWLKWTEPTEDYEDEA